jgi:class 3 adenylate cyclase/tetratricopeptide (TPR) repeat protein
MTEENNSSGNRENAAAISPGDLPDSIEKLLQERQKIDALLKEKFTRQITVLFTDIKDSTSFFASRGDIEGRLMVQMHNNLLFPIIKKYQGWVVKTIGDAIMAGFDDPLMAVRASAEMQQTLFAYNQTARPSEQIHIRIGINTGACIVEAQDIFGDVVNVAARIESLCEPDQILISSAVHEAAGKTDDIICCAVSPIQAKGIPGELRLYRVVWSEAEKAAGTTLRTTSGSAEKTPNKKRPLRGAVISAAIILLGSALILQWQQQKEITQDPYAQAYSFLQTNQPEQAQELFAQLSENDSRRYEGLAAVFFKTGALGKAQAMTAKAIELFPGNGYAQVINGNILFSQGKLEAAAGEYAQAARQQRLSSWQQAEALNGLGRICAVQGDLEKSLSYYAQAASLNPHSSVIYANQGMALEKRGAIAEASACYQKAVQANPQDPVASSLFAGAEKKQKAVDDQSRQARVDQLIAELVAAHRNARPVKSAAGGWTAQPLTISFINFQQKGAPAAREGEDEFFQSKLTTLLQEKGRVQVVEREVLDKLLEELKLSATDLADSRRALEVGKILSARLIVTGSVMRYGTDVQVAIQLTETETTSIKAAITETARDINELAEKTARKILSSIAKAYPIRGLISSVERNQAVLNIGADAGVCTGMEMKALSAEEAAPERQGQGRLRNIFRITAVEHDRAYAALPAELSGISKGMKVEEVVQ